MNQRWNLQWYNFRTTLYFCVQSGDIGLGKWIYPVTIVLSQGRPTDYAAVCRTSILFPAAAGNGLFLLATGSRPSVRPAQPPSQWVPGAIPPAVKRPGREAVHPTPSNAVVKNAWSYTSIFLYVFMAWYSVKHTDSFALPVLTYLTARK
jgi:hypothetical protein